MEMKIDSQLVRHERERRAWSQEHLASVAGLGLRTIQRIEATGAASYESVKAIAAVLDLQPSDLTIKGVASLPGQEGGSSTHDHGSRLVTGRLAPGRLKGALPAVVLAAGVLGGTAATILSPAELWWAGALVLASAIVLVRLLDNSIRAVGRQGMLRAVYLSTTCFLALTLAAYKDPEWVAMMIPILGGASVVVLSKPLGCLLGRRSSLASC